MKPSRMLSQLAKTVAKTCSGNCASAQINHGKTPTVPSRQEVVNTISQLGYAHIPSEFYLPNESQHLSPLLKKVQETYQAVPPDVSSPGNRFRSLIQYAFRPDQNDFIEIERSHEYYQTADTNHIDGGKVRVFGQIEKRFLENPLIKSIISKNIEMARQLSHLVKFDETLRLLIHQIRYAPKFEMPSYSSPWGLHKDDEPLAFIHLIQIDPNVIGGDTLISNDMHNIYRVFRLKSPLDTMVFTNQPWHAVTPMGNADQEKEAYRDLVYVDFINRK